MANLISRTFSCVVLSIALLATARADEEDGEHAFELTPFGGYRAGGEFKSAVDDSRRTLSDGASYGVIFNLAQSPDAYYELLYSKQNSQINGASPVDLSIEYLHFGGIVQYADEESRFIPYFALTIGATRFTPDRADLQSKSEFSFAVGGGMKVPLTSHLTLRAEARAFATLLDADSNIFCVVSAETSGCDIRVKGSNLIQVQGLVGVSFGF